MLTFSLSNNVLILFGDQCNLNIRLQGCPVLPLPDLIFVEDVNELEFDNDQIITADELEQTFQKVNLNEAYLGR